MDELEYTGEDPRTMADEVTATEIMDAAIGEVKEEVYNGDTKDNRD